MCVHVCMPVFCILLSAWGRHREKHGIKSGHPRRNKPKHIVREELGYHGHIRDKEGIPHPSEKYDYLHWEIEELQHEHEDALHLYGHNSPEVGGWVGGCVGGWVGGCRFSSECCLRYFCVAVTPASASQAMSVADLTGGPPACVQ